MRYVLQIYSPDGYWDSLGPKEQEALYSEYFAFTRDLSERGTLVGSHELEPASTAPSVRVRDG